MKVGIRKPNIKSSIKARTTGKVKRAVKKSVNPMYGKKGMGLITNPEKALYNKVYNKTTIDVRPKISKRKIDNELFDESVTGDQSFNSNNYNTNEIMKKELTPTEIKKLRNGYLLKVPMIVISFIIITFLTVLANLMFVFIGSAALLITYLCYCLIQSIRYTIEYSKSNKKDKS